MIDISDTYIDKKDINKKDINKKDINKKDINKKYKYEIRYNGGVSFNIVIEDKVYIYDSKNKLVKIIEYVGFWPGREYRYNDNGAIILIKLSKINYVIVSDALYYITIKEEVQDFINLMGYNEIPYPIITTRNKYMFVMDKVDIIDKKIFRSNNYNDLESEYYKMVYIDKNIKPKTRKFKITDKQL